jgi:hypothetical protein
MNETLLAFVVFGAMVVIALYMFWAERAAVARRKANGTYVDVSDVLFFGSKAVAEAEAKKAE